MVEGVLVRLKKAQPRFKLKKGDILDVVPYSLDPSKVTVVERVRDGFDPECNLYRHEVEPYTMGEPTEIKEFILEKDGLYGVGFLDDHPDQLVFVAQSAEGVRRAIALPLDIFELAALARGICELIGIRKLHHKVKLGKWHTEFGPRPDRYKGWPPQEER